MGDLATQYVNTYKHIPLLTRTLDAHAKDKKVVDSTRWWLLEDDSKISIGVDGVAKAHSAESCPLPAQKSDEVPGYGDAENLQMQAAPDTRENGSDETEESKEKVSPYEEFKKAAEGNTPLDECTPLPEWQNVKSDWLESLHARFSRALSACAKAPMDDKTGALVKDAALAVEEIGEMVGAHPYQLGM